MKKLDEILEKLPYEKPFLFVNELTRVDEDGAEGFYTFREDEDFYRGHFKQRPVTPGVILTECMAQIGVVCLGIHLLRSSSFEARGSAAGFVFSESHVVFEKAVFPGEKVKVVSEKLYWRLGKLKCKVELFNENGERVCHGEMSGMMAKGKGLGAEGKQRK